MSIFQNHRKNKINYKIKAKIISRDIIFIVKIIIIFKEKEESRIWKNRNSFSLTYQNFSCRRKVKIKVMAKEKNLVKDLLINNNISLMRIKLVNKFKYRKNLLHNFEINEKTLDQDILIILGFNRKAKIHILSNCLR